jgi:hypothetical protein
MTKRKYKQQKSKKSKKRKLPKSGSSDDKRQRLLGDTSEIGETKESDALPVIPLPVITKEELAAARFRQRNANSAESQSSPCIAVLYTKIKGGYVKGKGWVVDSFVPTGESISFTSRLKASDKFGGMTRPTIQQNIDNKSRSKIKGGIYEGKYVMLSKIIVEPIMFEGKEIKPAPARISERVKGDKYVVNDIVRIWGGSDWRCAEHDTALQYCVKCGGGAGICPCGNRRSRCKICRVQPLLHCNKCPTTWTSAKGLELHMRIHTGEKPHKCELCPYRGAQSGTLTTHKGRIHDIGNEQCTNCNKNCYRPHSWLDASNEVQRSCKKCYQDRFGVNIREEQEWSDWLDKRFYPKFRTCSDTRISMCTLFRPDGLYEFEGNLILYVDHLILHWEFDEGQHSGEKNRGDENRMLKMHEIEKYKYKHWVTVRVNPHGYTHPARNKAKPGKEERKELMLKVMKACLTKLWESRTNVVYMFYSENNPNIAKDISKTMLYDADDVDEFCENW